MLKNGRCELKKVALTLCFALLFVLLAGGVMAARLNHDWAAMKGMLRINHGMPEWYFDRDDPEQSRTAARLQRVYLLTDGKGSVLQESDVYAALDDDNPGQATWSIRRDTRGAAYLIRSGVVYSNDRSHDPYFVAIGRPLGRW